jgi:hypothetical protein
MPQFKIPNSGAIFTVRQSTIDLFVAAVDKSPGYRVKDYANMIGYGRPLLKNILRYTPEGANLRAKGVVAGSKARPAAWEQLPRTKLAPQPANSISLRDEPDIPDMQDRDIHNDVNSLYNELVNVFDTSYLAPSSARKKFDVIMSRFVLISSRADSLQTQNESLQTEIRRLENQKNSLIEMNDLLRRQIEEEDRVTLSSSSRQMIPA